jgi:hypothetical protein
LQASYDWVKEDFNMLLQQREPGRNVFDVFLGRTSKDPIGRIDFGRHCGRDGVWAAWWNANPTRTMTGVFVGTYVSPASALFAISQADTESKE